MGEPELEPEPDFEPELLLELVPEPEDAGGLEAVVLAGVEPPAAGGALDGELAGTGFAALGCDLD